MLKECHLDPPVECWRDVTGQKGPSTEWNAGGMSQDKKIHVECWRDVAGQKDPNLANLMLRQNSSSVRSLLADGIHDAAIKQLKCKESPGIHPEFLIRMGPTAKETMCFTTKSGRPVLYQTEKSRRPVSYPTNGKLP
ncbi:unnamed protein product [Rodentolepis nana]|uniref:Protein kinase domain-containing protein n=1 Tax=Rodentolepis nana TaxID=102285 RepID=A0A0R3TUX1_RODNA|nr:unnamed protein product [Rodentolepis nana]